MTWRYALISKHSPVTGIAFPVRGIPAPQGSKRHVGGGILIESSKKVAPWRDAVRLAAVEEMNGVTPFDGPLELRVTFTLVRPATVKRAMPHVRPDLDKLVRSTMDALTDAGVWGDDCQVVRIVTAKLYGIYPGADITVSRYSLHGEAVAA